MNLLVGLWLLRTVYITTRADPAPLLDSEVARDVSTVQAHLLDQLIPAVLSTRPPSRNPNDIFRPRRTWDAAKVQGWLIYLAQQLDQAGTRDLLWFDLARYTSTRHAFQRMVGWVVGLVAGLGAGLAFGLPSGLVFGLIVGLPVGLVSGLLARRHAGRCFELSTRQSNWLPARLLLKLLTRLTKWLKRQDRAGWPSTPRSHYKMVCFLESVQAFLYVPALGLPLALLIGLSFGLSAGLKGDLVYAFWFDLLSMGIFSWSKYILVVSRLAVVGKLPLRLMKFLDDASRLGLLRTVGPAYQFRHAEFHDHLIRTDSTRLAVSVPGRAPE